MYPSIVLCFLLCCRSAVFLRFSPCAQMHAIVAWELHPASRSESAKTVAYSCTARFALCPRRFVATKSLKYTNASVQRPMLHFKLRSMGEVKVAYESECLFGAEGCQAGRPACTVHGSQPPARHAPASGSLYLPFNLRVQYVGATKVDSPRGVSSCYRPLAIDV